MNAKMRFPPYNGGVDVRNNGHSVYKTEFHIVFATKYGRKALNPGFAKYTESVIREIVEDIEGVEVLEINVQNDHVHLFMIITPKYAVSKVVEMIKSRSAKVVREKFGWLDNLYTGTKSLWSRGFFASTVGINEGVIRNYIKFQQKIGRAHV